jgi:hypothetical protein
MAYYNSQGESAGNYFQQDQQRAGMIEGQLEGMLKQMTSPPPLLNPKK